MSMNRPRRNMGRLDWIGAEAQGVPGQRTFRLMAQGQQFSASIWLEKEQLQRLAEAIARMLAEISSERGFALTDEVPGSNPPPASFPSSPDVEMHVGTLGLRYDGAQDLIAIEAFEREAEDSDPPTLRCLATREQMEKLQANALEVISAGRPRCPFCGAPLTSAGMPHFCPPMNGHQKLAPDEE